MLDLLAFRYTQQSELTFGLIAFIFIVLGAVLSASFLPASFLPASFLSARTGLLSRSYFLQRLGLASVLLMINQMWWLLYVPLVTAGLGWWPAFTDVAGYLVMAPVSSAAPRAARAMPTAMRHAPGSS